jgi:hypothetical protein
MDISVIPEGVYCYKFDGTKGLTPEGSTWLGIKSCPYYKPIKGQYVACIYVGFIGWDACLSDQCKICGENEGFDNEDFPDN